MNKNLIGCLLALCLPGIASANLCDANGYVFGFFNGVGNTLSEAGSSADALQDIYGDTYNGEPISYEVFYNVSSRENGARLPLEDVAETFIQRAAEIDSTGQLAERIEMALENVRGADGFFSAILEVGQGITDLQDAVRDAFITEGAAALAQLNSNPPTNNTIREQTNQAEGRLLEGQKLMLIAHSQGNLFVNQTYDYITDRYGSDSIAVVHVAPASPTVRGPHSLADIDLIINALRAQGSGSVQPISIDLPFNNDSGHGFVPIYLDDTRQGTVRSNGASSTALQHFKNLMQPELDSLVTPEIQATSGAFTVTLTWSINGDIDLHTTEPDGTHVYYGRKIGNSGELDVDDIPGDGPEHYFATCDAEALQVGTYFVGINNYGGSADTIATLDVTSPSGGVLASTSSGVTERRGSSGNSSPQPMFEVYVSQDDSGEFSISALSVN